MALQQLEQTRQVFLCRDEDGVWIVECPSLTGCVSQGNSRDEALSNIQEAIAGYIAALQEDGLEIPQDSFETALVRV
jgi:predicted RNase H-like HicB family nuclease